MSTEHPAEPVSSPPSGGHAPLPKPTLRERLRPWELLGLSAIVAIVVGLVVLMSTREIQVASIFAGISFIVSLVMFAMLSLASTPTGEEQHDLDEQDRGH